MEKSKIILYTRECSFCGGIFPSGIEGKFRHFLDKKNIDFITKQITLYEGWRIEANQISETFDVKVPFFFFNKGKAIELNDLFLNNKFNQNILEDFIG